MSDQKQTITDPNERKRQSDQRPDHTSQPEVDTSITTETAAAPPTETTAEANFQSQAEGLNHPHLMMIQRQAMAHNISSEYGNQHMLQVMRAMKQGEASNRPAQREQDAAMPEQNETVAAEPAEAEEQKTGPATNVIMRKASAPDGEDDKEDSAIPRSDLGTKNDNSRVFMLDWDSKNAYINQDETLRAAFEENLTAQLKIFFGKEITRDQVMADIQQAEADGRYGDADKLRGNLFKANEYAVVETLDVEQSERYKKGGGKTYCNIYAYDVVSAMGGYIPRVWWNDDVIDKAKKGEVKPIYAKTVHELSANALVDWMEEHGTSFGWRKVVETDLAQQEANSGKLVILLAAHKPEQVDGKWEQRSGHINVIMPETGEHKALREKSDEGEEKVVTPLQSQAGGKNFKYKPDPIYQSGNWWEQSSYRDGAAWVFEGKPNSSLLTPEELGGAQGEARENEEGWLDKLKRGAANAWNAVTDWWGGLWSGDKKDAEQEQNPNDILFDMETTGASAKTAAQDKIKEGGVEASNKMAETDSQRVKKYAEIFVKVGAAYGLPPALLAAIASRESRGGNALENGWGDNGNGFGLMQVDKRYHKPAGKPDSEEHINQAAGILKGFLDKVKEKFPKWTPAQQLRGAVTAYNSGLGNVQTLARMDIGTTGNDYSADVWARARYYAAMPEFGGSAEVEAAAQADATQDKGLVGQIAQAGQSILDWGAETAITAWNWVTGLFDSKEEEGEKAGDKGPAKAEPVVTLSSGCSGGPATEHTMTVLKEILKTAGEGSAVINSTTRTPRKQAEAMYTNIVATGVDTQKNLYGNSGDKVIDVYVEAKAAGKDKEQILEAMEAKIEEVGPSSVSKHCGDPTVLQAIDVSPGSIGNTAAFVAAVNAAKQAGKVSKYIPAGSPGEPAHHLEIPQ